MILSFAFALYTGFCVFVARWPDPSKDPIKDGQNQAGWLGVAAMSALLAIIFAIFELK